jgi:hypothetical protein
VARTTSSNPPAAPLEPPGPTLWARIKRFFFRTFLFLFIAIPLLTALYIWVMLSYTYSHGERVGYVQKFSNKGWICKTWEGELAMANLPGAMPQIFHFTVRDPEVAARVNSSMGKRVSLHYEQHVGLPTTCFGDTNYFVDDLDQVEP